MTTIDLITILGNLSQSLYPVQRLISGGAYLLGVLFLVTAVAKLRKIADHKAQSQSHEKMLAPIAYLFMGAMLIFLPTAMDLMANTVFGTGNVLTYSKTNRANIYSVMGILIRTAGLLWFVRGCVLVTQASQPGSKDGPKGLVFILAGILSMNIDNTVAILNTLISWAIKVSLVVKNSQGF